jgi:hypothetical protein
MNWAREADKNWALSMVTGQNYPVCFNLKVFFTGKRYIREVNDVVSQQHRMC